MGRREQIALILLVLAALGTAGVAFVARRLYRELAPPPRVEWDAGRGCLHPVGCVMLAFLGVPMCALFPPFALLPALAFFVAGGKRGFRGGSTNRKIALLLVLCALIWAAYFGYEMQLNAWMATVRAPIRADIMLTGPLLYYVSVVGFAVANWSDRPDDSATR